MAYLLVPMEDGIQFYADHWPLHVTLADVFAIDRQSSGIKAKLKATLARRNTVTTTILNESVLGTTPVVLLDKTSTLLALHSTIISLLEANGTIFNDPQFTEEGFIPHYTIQEGKRLDEDDVINIDSVTLIDMFPGDDWQQRRVISTFKLQSAV